MDIVLAIALASYAWPHTSEETLANRFAPPEGFVREASAGFGEWLRGLPLLAGTPRVLLFDGREKGNQEAHLAVLDIDVGTSDLQQCADAVMRLRAEYLWSAERAEHVAFNFTSGDRAPFSKWRDGERPIVSGSKVRWRKAAKSDGTRDSFRAYLDTLFMYAGSRSLERELKKVSPTQRMQPGDVFIQGGSPGHAVIVLDVVVHRESGERRFLIAQSYMPAQQIQILRNPAEPESPWYPAQFGKVLKTPEWTFKAEDLRRFEE